MKENLLSDGTCIDLLEYVTTFKHRLNKSCEIANKNLGLVQTKMKTWYDKNTVEREFKPGDKVLALLPIPGRPLQARYFGPYIVEQRRGDLDYVINTPGSRKQKQLCHINMLKEYHDGEINKIVSIVSPVLPPNNEFCEYNSSTIVGNEIFDIDSTATAGNDKDTPSSKFENSDILANLDQKQCHL